MNKVTKKIFSRIALGLSFAVSLASGTKSMSMDNTYALPQDVNPDILTKNSVIIRCGINRSSGFAIGEKHILTSAHGITAYKLFQEPIECIALEAVKKDYYVPTIQSFTVGNVKCYDPLFEKADHMQMLKIVGVHFHESTNIQLSSETPNGHTLQMVLEILKESLQYGLNDAKKYCSYGTSSEFGLMKSDKTLENYTTRVFGPDIAILECAEPHGLPTLEIADPIQERTLLQIIGIAGKRYINNDSSQICAGVGCPVTNGDPVFPYKPAIYGQNFTCFPADDEGNYAWMNRVFLKISENKFFMDDQVYPNAPKGFGLIAGGDSGAGAVKIKNGKAYLAGIVSRGNIEPIFITVQNYLESIKYNPSKKANYDPITNLLCDIYKTGLETKDREKRWFITQCLQDVTHLKSWVLSVINEEK